MREVQAAGARLAVRDWGPDGGKPVLFWHALGPSGSGETIVEAVPPLAKRGFRVHAVDGPGFGESEALAPERYELEALLELVDALVAELALGPFVFMGHSWGG